MFNMTENEQKIYAYLEQEHGYVSPTVIGKKFNKGNRKDKHQSAWACIRCRRLIENGYVVKNHLGHYKADHRPFKISGDKFKAECVMNTFLYGGKL